MNRRGFTLLEILASMAILGTALLLFALAESTARRTVMRQLVELDAHRELGSIVTLLNSDARSALSVIDDSSQPAALRPGETAVLRLAMPGLSGVGDPIPGVFDEIIYAEGSRVDGVAALSRRVTPGEGSYRSTSTRVLSRRVERCGVSQRRDVGRTGGLVIDLSVRAATNRIANAPPAARKLLLAFSPALIGEGGR